MNQEEIESMLIEVDNDGSGKNDIHQELECGRLQHDFVHMC